jgi:PAS domain S-box-containing protein
MSGRFRILQIDSSSTTAAGIERALCEAGLAAECVRVGTPDELAAARCRAFDLVLAAAALPGMEIAQTIQTVKAAGLDAPVIVVLAGGTPETPDAALKAGAAGVVSGNEIGRLVSAVRQRLNEAEEAIRESEERFRRIFQYSAAGMVLVAPDLRFLKANDVFCRMVGYAEEELLGKTFQEVTHPDDRAVGGAFVQQVLAGKREAFQLEKRYLHRNGRVVWGLVSSSLLRDPAGRPMYFVTQIQDITQRKLAEEELRESESRYRGFVENALVGIGIADGNRIVYANRVLLDIFGYDTLERFTAVPLLDMVAPDDKPAIKTRMELVERGEPVPPVFECNIIRRDGSARSLLATSDHYPGGGGTLSYTVFQDVTELVQAKKFLRDIEERFKFIMESLNVGLWDWDIGTDRFFFSPACCKILSEAEIPSEHEAWKERLHLADRETVARTIREHLEGRTEDWGCDYRLRARDGGWVWVAGRGRVVSRNGGGRPRRMVGTMIDVTERKRTEQKLLERENDLRQLSARLIKVREEERNRIARNIHDDLGHAVMNVKMNLFLADMMIGGGKESVRAFLHEMKDQVDSLLEMIQYISMEIRPAVLYDLGLAEALRFYVKRFAEQTNIACVVRSLPAISNLPDETAITIYRIVQEVFVNMFRHSGCTEITLDLRIADDRVALTVADNGKGITPEEIGSSDSIGIMGMRERAFSLGGELSITGVPGRGTTVILTFPVPAKASA